METIIDYLMLEMDFMVILHDTYLSAVRRVRYSTAAPVAGGTCRFPTSEAFFVSPLPIAI